MLEKLFKDFDYETTDKNVKMIKEIHRAAEDIIDTAVRLSDSLKDIAENNDRRDSGRRNENSMRKSQRISSSRYDDEDVIAVRTKERVSSRKLRKTEDIETIADVLDYVSSMHDVDITYGSSEPNVANIVFVFSPRINVMRNKFSDSMSIDFNIDAKNIGVKKASVDRIVDAFDAFVSFVVSMIDFSSSKYFEANFDNGSLCIQVEKDLSIHAGLVALIVKALNADGEEGFVFNVGAYTCKVKGRNLLISSDEMMSSVPLRVFDDLYDSIPFLRDVQLTSSMWSKYQDNPDGLIMKIVLFMMKEDGGHVLDKKDLKVIDNLLESGMSSLTIGEEVDG